MTGLARLLMIGAALWPLGAVAQTAEECAGVDMPFEGFAGTVEAGLPEDLGGGWVIQSFAAASEAGTQSGANVMHCDSDNVVSVVAGAVAADGSVVVDARVDIAAIFREAIASPEATGIDDILSQIEAGGARVQPLAPDGRESCGCAVFYPDLRTDKTPWAEWSAQ